MLECTVLSTFDHEGESTVWKGKFFRECSGTQSDIVLLHNRFTVGSGAPNSTICNNGSVIGQILSVDPENATYTSRLIVVVNSGMIGQSISCEYDNGSVTSPGSIKLIQIQIQNGK